LEISAGVSSVAGTGPDGLPILAQRTVATQMVAANGRPIVLSGLSRVTSIRNNARMPILGKIPVVGYLAGGETDAQRETQIVFVLTPTIISGSESAITMAAQARNAIASAKGEQPIRPPANPLGFDQWLLSREAPAP
jgi:type II secretory pathway component GspD/PulD (secretin)